MKFRLIAAVALVVVAVGYELFSSANDSLAAPPASGDVGGLAAADAGGDFRLPLTDDGWLDLHSLLVASDGSRSLGNHRARFNDSRDRGSKIIFFDSVAGENDSADVYWWDGQRIVDSAGRAANPDNGEAYGVDPLLPNEKAIRPFRHGVGMVRNADADSRLRTNDRDCSAVAGGYPDWFLYRRGRTLDTFDEVIFYRNGFKSDPRTNPDPRRDIFSRNIYQGGGAIMGHRYLGGMALPVVA